MNTKLCICRDVLKTGSDKRYTGVFTWTGPTWRQATITGLVKKLPANVSDKDLRKAYRDAVKASQS